VDDSPGRSDSERFADGNTTNSRFYGSSVHPQNLKRVIGSVDILESSLLCDLKKLVNNEELSDVSFLLEGKVVYAHKVLCSRCEYFRAMFLNNMKESKQTTPIVINSLTHRAFLLLLEYLYSDDVEIDVDVAMDLFVAADQCGVDRLKALCERKINDSLDDGNVCAFFIASDMHNAATLREKSLDYILQRFDSVSKTPGFEDMCRTNMDLLLEVLRRRREANMMISKE